MQNRIFYSLKGRYAAVSVLLLVLVIVSTSVGYEIVSSSQQQATKNEEYRTEMIGISRLLRNSIWMSRENLEEFLLEPGIDGLHQSIQQELTNARQYTEKLKNNVSANNTALVDTLSTLDTDLRLLNEYVAQVINTRLDASKQYPAVEIGSTQMQPSQNKFYSAVELALNEILEENPTAYKNEIYQKFEKARLLWGHLIANFRMYLSNRLGSFAESLLPIQEKDSALMVDEIRATLQDLRRYEESGKLGFLGAESLVDMTSAFNVWVDGYIEVLQIHQSGAWRTDKGLLLQNIKPLYLQVWDSQQQVETILRDLAVKDINDLSTISNVQQRIIVGVGVLSIIIIVLGYGVLHGSILRPIALLTNALKQESLGNSSGDLPKANAEETKNLLHAFVNMQKQIHARQDELKYRAMHDDLTGLPNRNLMQERLNHVIAIAKRENRNPTLLMMDLDGFKQVNDTLGHQVGDALLVAVGMRLLDLLRECDTVIRLGGDEFAVLIDDVSTADAIDIAKRVLQVVMNPFTMDESQLYVAASIGIAQYPFHGDSADLLIQHADVAMYHAKKNKLGVSVYDNSVDENKLHKLSLLSDLRDALKEDKLELYFQPKVCLKTNKTLCVEALLRWNHPVNGFVPPDQIIALAEQSGLISEIFVWVFDRAARQARYWLDIDLDINISVNLSVYDVQHHNITHSITSTLKKYNLSPSCFTLEVTESAMMDNPEKTIEKLSVIDQMGLRISIDDYGTGYSSLSYMKKLPVDELKIDKSFVMQMDKDENDAIIVRSTIDLAHNLGLKVVAEGVENQEILDLLIKHGCDTAQGFYLSRPVPAEKFEAWIVERESVELKKPKFGS